MWFTAFLFCIYGQQVGYMCKHIYLINAVEFRYQSLFEAVGVCKTAGEKGI